MSVSASANVTPKRNNSSESTYSPITLRQSPAAQSAQRNLTGYPRVIRDLAADIHNTIQKWNSLIIKGADVVKTIASLKSNSADLFPSGLETLCLVLSETVDVLKENLELLKMYSQQMCNVAELIITDEPIFISWTAKKFVNVAEEICNAFSQEYEVKHRVSENIAHVKGKDRVMFYAVCWTHHPYISDAVIVALEGLLTETGYRNKI